MNERLSPFWLSWRKLRTLELEAEENIQSDLARQLATREARSRQFAEGMLGREAALTVDLIDELRPDGTFSSFAAVPVEMIPADRLPAARAWAALGPKPAAWQQM